MSKNTTVKAALVVTHPMVSRSDDNKIHVPDDMKLSEAARTLAKAHRDMESNTEFKRTYVCHLNDFLAAMSRAVATYFGFVSNTGATRKSMFGKKFKVLPVTTSISVSATERVQVTESGFEIPGMEGAEFDFERDLDAGGRPCVTATISGKKKFGDQADQFLDAISSELEDRSIYRGQALRVTFRVMQEGKEVVVLWREPEYMDIGSIQRSDLIFSRRVEAELDMSLFARLDYPDACKEAGVSNKSVICIIGVYGSGKTLTAKVAAAHATANGRTFIYLSDVRDLEHALRLAKMYGPAVVFAEDIDRITSVRDDATNQLINTIDGIDTKDDDLLLILTTNFVDRIDPAMLRKGRMDHVILLDLPDVDAAERLLWLYGADVIEETSDLYEVACLCEGMIPAEIKEVIERGKKACVYRSGGLSPFIVTPSDLLDAAIQIKKESVMLTVVPKDERPDIIQAAEVLGRHLGQHEPDTGIYMDLKAHDVSLNGAGGVNQAIEDDQDALDEAALALDAGF